MTTKQNSALGGSNGVACTAGSSGNTGGSSGTFLDLFSPSGGTVFDTATTLTGSSLPTYKQTPASGATCVMRWSGFASLTGSVRCYVEIDTLQASGNEAMFQIKTSGDTSVIGVAINPSNQYVVTDSTGASFGHTTATYQSGDRLELTWTSDTTSTGSFSFAVYRGDAASAVTGGTLSSTTGNLGTANWAYVQFGKASTSTYTGVRRFTALAAADGTTNPFGPYVAQTGPTAAFITSTAGLTLSVNGSGSSASSPATITSYDWNWGDGTAHGSGATATHSYAAAGTYTVTLTVTDSNGLNDTSTSSVTVAAASGTVTVSSMSVATGWTPSSGTVLSCLTDADPSTLITSQNAPSAQELDFVLQALTPAGTGQPLKVFLQMDAVTATTSTLAAQLFEGSTQRSALTGVTIPAGSGSSVAGLVTLTFPWSDVQNISTGGWNALTVKLQITAS